MRVRGADSGGTTGSACATHQIDNSCLERKLSSIEVGFVPTGAVLERLAAAAAPNAEREARLPG